VSAGDDVAVPDQAEVDRITFESWLAWGRNASKAARELDCSPATVRARVKRHQAVVAAAAAPANGGPPPRCPGGGQTGLGGVGSPRCPVCTQDAAPVKRDGTLGSHKLLKLRDGAQ
jgi:hypothetical protein